MSILSRLFQKSPRYHVSGYRTLYSAVVTRLTRTGVTIGSTARYPRVEIHSFREQERLDKEGALRQINFIVESISNKSLDQATTMNEDNLKLLGTDFSFDDYKAFYDEHFAPLDIPEDLQIDEPENLEIIDPDAPQPEPEPEPDAPPVEDDDDDFPFGF